MCLCNGRLEAEGKRTGEKGTKGMNKIEEEAKGDAKSENIGKRRGSNKGR